MENSSKLSEKHSNESKSSLIGRSGGTCSGDNIFNQKQELLRQFDPHLKEQLLPHIWNVISYNPLKFYIAHNEHKQIIISSVKKEKLNVNDGNFNLSLTNEIHSLCPTKIIIEAIPIEVTRHDDPLGLSSEHKYTITFETQIEKQKTITIGPKSLDEILQELHNRTLIVDQQTKAAEALSSIILAMEKDNKVIINKDVTTPGFYLINNQIKGYNIDNYHPNPSKEEITKCLESLELLQQNFKNKDVFPTVLKWSVIAPFNYVMKQANRNSWMPWLYLYGFPRTGKTTLGHLESAIWGHYNSENYILPFTNVDTNAKLGEALSKSTYPLLINETGALSDDSKFANNRNLIEMIKTSIEGMIARSKFFHKTIYTEIPSLCACILTSNSTPPSDIGFNRRTVAIPFTQNDEYSLEEIKEFEKLLETRIKHELPIVGNFVANYILNNQNLLLTDKKNWKELSLIILKAMYSVVEKGPPQWIESTIENEIQLEESKEELDLILRNLLINKVNEAYSKHHRSIDSCIDGTNQPFTYRLDFSLDNNLIPFLNINTNNEIIITSDFIKELKGNRINNISSLQEVSTIINGFEYGQKKLGKNKNVKAAYGSRIQFLEFLAIVG